MNVGNIGSTQNAAAEAMETAAQTKAEAAMGDQQAVQKLARRQVLRHVQSVPSLAGSPPPPVAAAPAAPQPAGTAKGGLDVKA
jgi:hypothetical protein